MCSPFWRRRRYPLNWCLPVSTVPRVEGAFPAQKTQPSLRTSNLPPERQNHARELVCVEDLSLWDALVVMSGDGLIHEVRAELEDGPEGSG